MDVIDLFLYNNTSPESYELLMATHNQLIANGHVGHELNIQNYVSLEGTMDNSSIVSLIYEELLKACHEHTLSYYIVCRKDDKLKSYLNLFEFMHYLEHTIDSSTVIYHLNDELEPLEQLLSWVDVFRNDLNTDISDLVLDVTSSLIDNVAELHELKVDVEPVELDVLFHTKIGHLKNMREHTKARLLGVELVKRNLIKTVHSIEELYFKFNKYIYSQDTGARDVALNIISVSILSSNDISSIVSDSRELTNLLYDDVKKTNDIIANIDDILTYTGDLWKTMNTI